jgi:putative heme-binding domain-containing protein
MDLINALARFSTPEIAATLLELYPAMTAKLRAATVTALSSRADWARSLLEEVDRGQIKKEQVSVGNLMAIQKLGDPQTEKLLKKHWGNLRPTSEEKEKLIQNVRGLLMKAKGDPAKGHELFKTLCANCHTLNGEGGKVGPELTGYERDNLDFLLPSIIDPSLGIREEFTAFNLTTKDEQTFTGFIAENTPKSVTILDANNTKTTVAREDIKTLAASATSLMPEGLLEALTPEQVRDLLAYVMKK